ncbi:MAG: nickel-dependent lactate racemase [Candidatus Aminicenantes bacterium]|nr:nickel-dependent lactate racemase [Candidatus Aminicenantes bacterium]
MRRVHFNLGRSRFSIKVPEHSDLFEMGKAVLIEHPEQEINKALSRPIGSPPLSDLIRTKLKDNPRAAAVVVISDSTRPVPYKGKQGILFPIIHQMREAGLPSSRIKILVATGTHRPMSEQELRKFLDPRIFELGIDIVNHDCRNKDQLMSVGKTDLGGEILLNRSYVQSDIKICTGLVESHFMAGVSGGRKSICPGIISEDSTYLLHSGPILSSPLARDLVLRGNPVHEEALRVAQMAGCDMIVNVTLDSSYRLTGIFAGDLEQAHLKAFESVKEYASIPIDKKYDIVITHTGYVGVNHYQAAKAAVVCSSIIKDSGLCVLASQHTDTDPVGGALYKKMIRHLREKGAQQFVKQITDPLWTFVPEQWEAQMWARLFEKIPFDHLLYCTQEIPKSDFSWLPGRDARILAPEARSLKQLTQQSVFWALNNLQSRGIQNPEIAVLLDGPYGIPINKNQ